MDSETIQTVLFSTFFCFLLLSGLLLIGAFLRSKVTFIQSFFLPASVVGGFIGLLLGPVLLKDFAIIPIPQDWITIFAFLPGILIVPVIASIPLGVHFTTTDTSTKKKMQTPRYSIILMFAVLCIIAVAQNVTGLLTGGVFKHLFHYDNIYATFGTELAAGFTGGHGTAGVVANMLQNFDQPYWEIAQGVTTTTATIGIISGILIGIFMINIAARLGHTQFIQSAIRMTSIQDSSEYGKVKESAGVETTDSTSIDSLSFHLALILCVSGLSFLTTFFVQKLHIPLIEYIPEWGYAIIIMYIVWGGMQKANIAKLIDHKTTTKIRATLTEFTIVAAIVSLPLQAISAYFIPILIMACIGLIVTILLSCYLAKINFRTFWFEKSMVIFGTSTGVFLTGLILLKMVDPKMESSVLRDYSISFTIYSLFSFILFPLSFGILVHIGFTSGIAFFLFILCVFITGVYVARKKESKSSRAA